MKKKVETKSKNSKNSKNSNSSTKKIVDKKPVNKKPVNKDKIKLQIDKVIDKVGFVNGRSYTKTKSGARRNINKYFKLCEELEQIPLVTEICMIMGIQSKEFTDGNYPENLKEVMSNAITVIQSHLEKLLLTEKANNNFKLLLENLLKWDNTQKIDQSITIDIIGNDFI